MKMRFNKLKQTRRIMFNWFELFLLVSNILHTICMPFMCTWLYLPFIVQVGSSMSIYRLMMRIFQYKRNSFIIVRSTVSFLQNLIPFCILVVIFSIVGYSIFSNNLLSCKNDSFEGITNESECLSEGGKWEDSELNFNTIFKSLWTGYALIDRSSWSPLIESSIVGWKGWIGYLIWEVAFTLFAVSTLNIIYRAFTVALCYVNLGTYSIVNIDPMLSLSRAQLEWIKIQERLAKTPLLKKKEKLLVNFLSGLCYRIINSAYNYKIYYTVLLLSFILNLLT